MREVLSADLVACDSQTGFALFLAMAQVARPMAIACHHSGWVQTVEQRTNDTVLMP